MGQQKKSKNKKLTSGELLNRAREVAKNSYSPYSEFAVGAAVETDDGQVFVGTNVENASFGVTLCAEGGALQAAASAGMFGRVLRIAIAGGPQKLSPEHRPKAISPCGRCRQLIAESAMLSQNDIEVIYSDAQGTVVKQQNISQLLPDAFEKDRLK